MPSVGDSEVTSPVPITLRGATEKDLDAIRALMRGERLNPTGIDWRRFMVAIHEGSPIGAVQLRLHADGSRELGSLVVSKAVRGRGIAARLIEARLAGATERILTITGARYATY